MEVTWVVDHIIHQIHILYSTCNLFLKHIQRCPDLNFKCKYNCLASYQLIFLSHLDWGIPIFSMENLYKLHATQNYLISKENNWGFQHKLPGVIERTNSNLCGNIIIIKKKKNLSQPCRFTLKEKYHDVKIPIAQYESNVSFLGMHTQSSEYQDSTAPHDVALIKKFSFAGDLLQQRGAAWVTNI